LSEFYHSDAGVNWIPFDLNQTKDSFLFVIFDLQLHVTWTFPKFNKDEKLSINTTLPFASFDGNHILLKSISLG